MSNDDLKMESASNQRNRLDSKTKMLYLIGAPPVLYLTVFYAIPLLVVVYLSLFPDGTFSLEEYRHVLEYNPTRSALLKTLQISVLATLTTALIGTFLIVALEIGPRWAKPVIMAALVLPFVAAGELVRIVSWYILLSPNGMVAQAAAFFNIVEDGGSILPGAGAVVIGLVHVLLPFYVFTVYAATRKIDKRPMIAAVSMGARPIQALLSIYVPLAIPAIVAGALIAFVMALGYYATPAALGGSNALVFPVLIQEQARMLGDWPQAAALGVFLLMLTGIVLFMLFRIGGMDVLYSSAGSGMGKKGSNRILTVWLSLVCSPIFDRICQVLLKLRGLLLVVKIVFWVIVGGTVVYLAAPLIVTIGASFNGGELILFPPTNPGVRWYEEFLTDPIWVSASFNSAAIALISTIVGVCFAVCCAIVINRGPRRVQTPMFMLAILPMVTPWIVVTLGMFFQANVLGYAYTLVGIVIGHIVHTIPFAVIVLSAAVGSFDWNIDRAARSVGANMWHRSADIVFPILRPAILTAMLFSFVASLSEVPLALFMSRIDLTTLPVLMWQGLNYSMTPLVAAAGGLLILACVFMSAVYLVSQKIFRRV